MGRNVRPSKKSIVKVLTNDENPETRYVAFSPSEVMDLLEERQRTGKPITGTKVGQTVASGEIHDSIESLLVARFPSIMSAQTSIPLASPTPANTSPVEKDGPDGPATARTGPARSKATGTARRSTGGKKKRPTKSK